MDRIEKRHKRLDSLREKVESAVSFEKENPMTKVELLDAIKKSKNRKELDLLRSLVVSAKDKEVLEAWQKKFWRKK
jgi:hypothetical protein